LGHQRRFERLPVTSVLPRFADIQAAAGMSQACQQRKCPPHSFTSSASGNGTGAAVMFGYNASER